MSQKLYPLTAPGMPMPGPDFIALAQNLGDDSQIQGKGAKQYLQSVGPQLQESMRKALYAQGDFTLNISGKAGRTFPVQLISGHLWADTDSNGPRPADVMVLGKMLTGDDYNGQARVVLNNSIQFLAQTLKQTGIKGWHKWYITALVKCMPPEGDNIKSAWLKEFMPLLHQELRIVRPKYLLCLGADAIKALLGKQYTLQAVEGRAVDLVIPLHESEDQEPEYHTIKVMCCIHPAAVLKSPEMRDRLDLTLVRFKRLLESGTTDVNDEVDHRVITRPSQLRDLVDEIRNSEDSYVPVPDGEKPAQLIAVDAEWNGQHPQNKGSYVRTIQISWADRKAACIVLTHEGGTELRENWIKFCITKLKQILKSDDERDVRVTMHFGVADLEWLVELGLDIRREFQAAPNWQDCWWKGGIDTGAGLHALEETAELGLKGAALKHTTAPRYDVALDTWKKRFCSERGLKASELEGYGECPLDVLAPYGNYDADVTRRIAIKLLDELKADQFGNNCWKSFWTTQRVLLPILEMHRTGLMVDRKRIEFLTEQFLSAQAQLLSNIRTHARWPELNVNSVFQVREFLFGEEHNSKRDADGRIRRLRPEGAISLGMTPVLTTGKRAQAWDELEEDEQEEAGAATKSMVLSILIRENAPSKQDHLTIDVTDPDSGEVKKVRYAEQMLKWLRDYRYASQVLRYVLRPPATDDDTLEYVRDGDGQYVYKRGLPSAICDDGFVRTHLHPTKETYRWSSTRPPLQNLSKKREPDYKRILGSQYRHPLRSIITVPPGYVLVEADYIGAELYGMGMLSDDEQMIEHCQRNQLPEDHPDFYDIHSNVAKLAFRLDCEPTKQGLIDIGKEHLRIVAKSVVFGIAYGRGARAIAMAAREEGIQITENEAQQIIDTLFDLYPRLKPFFEQCKLRASSERWVSGVGGQFRRMPAVIRKKNKEGKEVVDQETRKLTADLERQLMNFPIQNMIAWAVDRAVDYLYTHRRYFGLDYKLSLQIHDALLFTVRGDHVGQFIDEVLPKCMKEMVPIYPTRLDGRRLKGRGPYFLGIDTEACIHWGEVPMPNQLLDVGADPMYAHWKLSTKKDHGIAGGYVHGKFKDKSKKHRVWIDGKFMS